jgi:hypothetical protein
MKKYLQTSRKQINGNFQKAAIFYLKVNTVKNK